MKRGQKKGAPKRLGKIRLVKIQTVRVFAGKK